MDVEGCLACDLAAGRRPLPGGVLVDTGRWLVEHTVEPLLRRTAAVVAELVRPEQVYVCLWSHAGGVPVHIHFVVQPATRAVMDEHGVHGPFLQTAMFAAGVHPPATEVEAFCDRARAVFAEAA